MPTAWHIPRLLVSAARGGAGKTLLTLGLARELVNAGVRVRPCKKGPDYIDATWLALASRAPCANLDPFFLEPGRLRALVQHVWRRPTAHGPCATGAGESAGLLLIEGNRGLFDGRDVRGSCSSAELARTLACPVLLSLDVTKVTRTAAALVHGLNSFDPTLRLAGVVLNQCASPRHEGIVRQSIERHTDVPVLGALPRFARNPLPERHMGLDACVGAPGSDAPPPEAEAALADIARQVREHVDMAAVLAVAEAAPDMPTEPDFWEPFVAQPAPRPRIGYVHDAALWFYYPENLEALQRAGAELLRLSLLDATPWPDGLHGLYLGGGFPEEWGATLAASPHMARIRSLAAAGMPIYAECGGFMLLAQCLHRDGSSYPMCGVLPVSVRFTPRPQGLGYVQARVAEPNPYHPQGADLRGHEFHYSRCEATADALEHCVLTLDTGVGMGANGAGSRVDGLVRGRVFASYTHIYAPAAPHWAANLVQAARDFMRERA